MGLAEPMARGDSSRKKKQIYTGIVIAIVAILLLLLLRTCRSPVKALPFDYLRVKAEELGKDPAKILAFVRDQVGTLSYRGNLKGPLATLWNGAGSCEEKKALGEALLGFTAGPRALSLDEVAPSRNKAGDDSADAKAAYKLKIVHRVIKKEDREEQSPVDTVVYDGPCGALVGDVHSIEVGAAGKAVFTVRAKPAVTKEVSCPADALAEQVVFSYLRPLPAWEQTRIPKLDDSRQPPGKREVTLVRELWHRENHLGPQQARVGDRHDFVVLPARIGKYVREKEEQILKEQDRLKSAEAKQYLALLDYSVTSDSLVGKIERKMKVTAQYARPRILIWSKLVAPTMPGGVAQSLDLRGDAMDFDGGAAMFPYLAAQMRSLAESGLEQHFLQERTGLPCTSTFDVFNHLQEDYPDSCARRMVLIRRTLADLGSFSAIDAKATFSVHRGAGAAAGAVMPQVVVTRDGTGALHLKGGPVSPEFVKSLAATAEAARIPYGADGMLDASIENAETAAIAVETTLAATKRTPSVPPDYVLEVALDRGNEPLVEPGSSFTFAWGEGESRTDQRIDVEESTSGLSFGWRVQTSAIPRAGKRSVSGEALAGAMVHNPWYLAGSEEQKDATSFCVSRSVYQAIKSGKPIELAVQGRYGANDDQRAKRPVEFKGMLTPAGTGAQEVVINGQKEKLAVLQCTLNGQPIAILEDPTFPIGMADKLTKVVTSVRGRLEDENKLPIANATIVIGRLDRAVASVQTAADGSFRLRPPVSGSYGKVNVQIVLGDEEPIQKQVDLTSPGLGTVVISVKRPRTKLVYIRPGHEDALDGLRIGEQIKRYARHDLDAGRAVVIPNRPVRDGDLKLIGYYACDCGTGNYVGVTEDGLNGSTTWMDAVQNAAKETAIKMTGQAANSGAFHMFRGAVVSWWVYSTHRLAGESHKEAILSTLAEANNWAKNLGLTSGLSHLTDDPTGAALAGALSMLVNQGLMAADGATAEGAFKIGYIGGTVGLARMLGDEE